MSDYTNGAYFPAVHPDYHWSRQYCAYLGISTLPDPITDWPLFFPDDTSIGLDESLQTGIGFYFPSHPGVSDSVTIAHQNMPVTAWAERTQTLLLSGGGEYSVYDGNYKHRTIEVKLFNITMTKLHRLYKFLMNITKGALKTFAYVDESGTKYTVRWVDKKLIRNTHHVGSNIFLSDITLHLWVKSIVENYVS